MNEVQMHRTLVFESQLFCASSPDQPALGRNATYTMMDILPAPHPKANTIILHVHSRTHFWKL